MESLQFSTRFSVNRVQCTQNRTRSRTSRATCRSAFTGTTNSASLSSKSTSTVWLQICFLSICFVFSFWLFIVVCDVCVESEGDMELGEIKDSWPWKLQKEPSEGGDVWSIE